MIVILSLASEYAESMLACSYSPVFVQVSQRIDGNVTVLDTFHSREDQLDVLPVNDSLTVHMAARDFFDFGPSCEAKRLGRFHDRYSMADQYTQEVRKKKELCVFGQGLGFRVRGGECR